MFEFKQFIGGAWVGAGDGGEWPLINPATEDVIALIPYAGAEGSAASDAEAAIDAAHTAFKTWSRRTAYERGAILYKAAAWIRERIPDLAAITSEESGKPLRESIGEWTTGASYYEWYAEEGKRTFGSLIPSRSPNKRLLSLYQPMGVIGVITAWNFPVYNPARAWAAALAAGNTVVARPSEYTPRSAMLYAQALVEAGIPEGVINVLNGDADVMGKVMLRDARVRKISFTGSTRVGKLLMDGASQTVTKLALEMGGNAPVIVFPDVDVAATAQAAVASKYRNNGQVCIAPQRFYVHSRLIEEFTEAAAEASRALKLGSGLDKSVSVGPLINAQQRARVEAMVQEAAAEGAQVVTGGARPPELAHGYFFQPTVMANIAPTMRLYEEEIFGPVMPIIGFEDTEEVLTMANALEYGLAAYVHTHNLNTAIHMYERLEYGMVAINDWLPSTPEAAFGGMKQSGIGRESGRDGIYEYLEQKTVFLGGITP